MPGSSNEDLLRAPMLQKTPVPVAWVEFSHPNGRGRATLTGFLLGASLALVPTLLLVCSSATPFAIYFALLVCFHISEYLLTAAFRPDTLSFDNFLLNHSSSYQWMIALAIAEYWLEFYFLDRLFYPGCKEWSWTCSVGLASCVVGLVARSVGMATASTNFSHRIEHSKRQAN